MLLAATASLQPGGARLRGNVSMQYETNADIAAVRDDVVELRDEAGQAPSRLRTLCIDAAKDLRILAVDAKVTAYIAVRRLATLIRHNQTA